MSDPKHMSPDELKRVGDDLSPRMDEAWTFDADRAAVVMRRLVVDLGKAFRQAGKSVKAFEQSMRRLSEHPDVLACLMRGGACKTCGGTGENPEWSGVNDE